MLHLVALDRKHVVKSTNDALLTAINYRLIFDCQFLVIENELGAELIWVIFVRADSVVKLNDFFKLVLARLSVISVYNLSYHDVSGF